MLEKPKNFRKKLNIGLVSVLPLINFSAQAINGWIATNEVRVTDTSGAPYYDSVRFGATNNATRNYDPNVDKLDPPAPPSPFGVNTYMRPDNVNSNLTSSFVSCTDSNRSFKGIIVYDPFLTLTSTVAKVTGLPSDYKGVMLTYSDAGHSTPIGNFKITNNSEINIGTDVKSYIITEVPRFTGISASRNSLNPNNLDVALQSVFYASTNTSLDAYYSTNLALDNFTSKGLTITGSNGVFSGTHSNLNAQSMFYKLVIP